MALGPTAEADGGRGTVPRALRPLVQAGAAPRGGTRLTPPDRALRIRGDAPPSLRPRVADRAATLPMVKPRNRPTRVRKPPFRKPALAVQPTTLWDYPSQDYGDTPQGVPGYKGATPSYVVWNLLQRYTKPNDLVVDPCAGSGTTLDVARDLGRRALGYDIHPTRKDIFRVDARKLPPELTSKVDFVFIDPPYSTHLDYGPDPRDIGKLDAAG